MPTENVAGASSDPTIQDFVKLPFFVYGMVGVKLFSFNSEDKMTRRAKIIVFLTTGNLVLCFFFMMAYVLFEEGADSISLAAIIIYLVFAFNSFSKMLSVYFGRKTLRDVFFDMNKTFPHTERQRQEYRVREYYANIDQYMKFVIIFHAAAVMTFTVFPIVQSSLEFLIHLNDNDVEFIYRFPYIMKYPFNEFRPFTFLFAYVTQTIAGVACSCFFVGSDLMLLTTVQLLNMQFEYLTHRIERFNSKSIEEDLHELSEIVIFHDRTLDFSTRINNVFSISILLNYISTTACLCLVGFQLSAGSGFVDLTKFVAFLISAVMHIYYICVFGQRLNDLSEGLSDVFSSQQWYDADIKYQRMLPIAIMRAQRPAYLTAYKFFNISMESFSNLISTSYRVFTLIESRYEESATN